MAVGMACTGQLKNGDFKRWLNQVSLLAQELRRRTLGCDSLPQYRNRPKAGIHCVGQPRRQSTSSLACDNAMPWLGNLLRWFSGLYSAIQRRPVRFGVWALWNPRTEWKSSRLKEHVEDPNKLPILLISRRYLHHNNPPSCSQEREFSRSVVWSTL